jgi:pimeloyl-ACP methyl ester carboxylesterase
MFVALIVAIPLLFSLWGNSQLDQQEIYQPADIAPGHMIAVDGLQIHYQTWGNPNADPTGAPILLIHGFASSGQEFFRLAPLLAARRSVIAVDLLGFGFSQRVTEPGPYFSKRGEANLVAAVLQRLGIQRVDVVGASYGGAIAGELALDHPNLVRRVVFMDAQIYDEGRRGGALAARLPFGINRAVTWLTLGGGPLSTNLFDFACHDAAACLGDGDLIEALRPPTEIRGNVASLIAFSQSPRDQRLPDDIAQIAQPALVLWGDDDRILPPADGERLANDLPNAQIIWIAEAGHVPHIERPAEVATAILTFLGP